ncbi:MAG: DUF1804 family protein [Bacteroidota bacterium]
MARKIERLDAKRLYIEELKEIPDISKQLNVPEATIYRWKSDDKEKSIDWDKERESIRMTSASAYKQTLKIAIDKLNEFAAGGEVDVKQADAIIKIIKAAKSLYKDVDSLGNIYLAMEEWIEFLHQHDPDMLKQLLPLLEQFRQTMSKKYGRKRT